MYLGHAIPLNPCLCLPGVFVIRCKECKFSDLEFFSSEITLFYDVLSVGTIKIDGNGTDQVVNSERKRKMD